MIGEYGDNLQINPQSNFSLGVLAAASSLKIPLSLMWEWMVPPDRDPATRLIWNVDPQQTPFMVSVLQRYSLATMTQTSSNTAAMTETKAASIQKTTISASSSSLLMPIQPVSTTGTGSTYVVAAIGIISLLAVTVIVFGKRRRRNV